MLPNRFPDHGEQPEFNAVDASLWFIIAAYEYLQASRVNGVTAEKGAARKPSKQSSKATARAPATESAWTAMGCSLRRARRATHVDGRESRRMGGHAAHRQAGRSAGAMAECAKDRQPVFAGVGSNCSIARLVSFRRRFWNEAAGCLHDVVDVNHQPGAVDATFRPNQILAVGGLPFSLLEPEQAARCCRSRSTPVGADGLALACPRRTRLHAALPGRRRRARRLLTSGHRVALAARTVRRSLGTSPRRNTTEVKREARGKFLAPLLAHLEEAGLGHISEIADAEQPHTPRGCPFQAWSVGEALRLDRVVSPNPAGEQPTACQSAPKYFDRLNPQLSI